MEADRPAAPVLAVTRPEITRPRSRARTVLPGDLSAGDMGERPTTELAPRPLRAPPARTAGVRVRRGANHSGQVQGNISGAGLA